MFYVRLREHQDNTLKEPLANTKSICLQFSFFKKKKKKTKSIKLNK